MRRNCAHRFLHEFRCHLFRLLRAVVDIFSGHHFILRGGKLGGVFQSGSFFKCSGAGHFVI